MSGRLAASAGPSRTLAHLVPVLLALALGLLHTASFAPVRLPELQPLALAGLVALAWSLPWRRAALLGGAFGLGWLGAGLWWLYVSLHDFGGLHPVLAVAAVALLVVFLSLYPAAALALFGRTQGAAWPWRVLGFAAAWLASELARAQWFTGFPWIASGYAHSSGPLAPWAPWVGVYGLGFLAALLAASGAAALVRRPGPGASGRRHAPWAGLLVVAATLLALPRLLPQGFTQPSGSLPVTLLQPNVAQSSKFDPALIDANLEALLQQVEAARTPLVVTPESVLPMPMAYLPAAPLERLLRASLQRTVWLGTFLGSDEAGWVNSMTALHQGRPVHDYGKRHLLPFGEFIPPGLTWFVRALNIPIDSQARGQHQHPLVMDGLRLRALICYELLFGEDIVASAVAGPEAADVLVTTSNLAWFGAHVVQDQFLQFSQLRALEFERPVLHATNTGPTAGVDHQGRVQARLALLTRDALVLTVTGRQGSTPYARWLGAAGLWPLWGLATLLLAASMWAARRGRAGGAP